MVTLEINYQPIPTIMRPFHHVANDLLVLQINKLLVGIVVALPALKHRVTSHVFYDPVVDVGRASSCSAVDFDAEFARLDA